MKKEFKLFLGEAPAEGTAKQKLILISNRDKEYAFISCLIDEGKFYKFPKPEHLSTWFSNNSIKPLTEFSKDLENILERMKKGFSNFSEEQVNEIAQELWEFAQNKNQTNNLKFKIMKKFESYTLSVGKQTIEMPKESKILKVGNYFGEYLLLALIDPEKENEEIKIQVILQGNKIEADFSGKYIGSFEGAAGFNILHAFII